MIRDDVRSSANNPIVCCGIVAVFKFWWPMNQAAAAAAKERKGENTTITCSKPHRHCHCHHCSSFIVIPFRKLFLGLILVGHHKHTHTKHSNKFSQFYFSSKFPFACLSAAPATVVVAFYAISEWIETENWQCALCNILCKRWMSILHSRYNTLSVRMCE